MADGKDQLVKQSDHQESPRNVETEGGDGDSMAASAANVAAAWKVSRNGGESSSSPSSPSMPESVDMSSGKIMSAGYKKTRVDEVPDKLLSIG